MNQNIKRANPFIGLRSFEAEEHDLYFGRESQTAEACDLLRLHRFLAVVGSSGSGKSSLVRAGIIPALEKSEWSGDKQWRQVVFRPGNDPMGRLAKALYTNAHVELKEMYSDEGELLNALRNKDRGGAEILDILRRSGRVAMLLVVDQFEEIFRFRQSTPAAADETALFMKTLARFTASTEAPMYVILTMRADFLSDCSEYSELTALLNQGTYLVPRMTKEERRNAVSKPIELFGAKIAPQLVSRVIEDAGDDPDVLPILQHAMMRTWDYWKANELDETPIDIAHYEAVGSIKEALPLHAEEVFAALPDHNARRIAEKLFKSLTNIGLDNRGTRRPTPLNEICALAEAREEDVVAVIDLFRRDGCAFLTPPLSVLIESDTVIDISHESLMRVWGRLREWVEEEVQSARLYLNLSQTSRQYQEGVAGLLVSPQLQIALDWRSKNNATHYWASRYDTGFDRVMLYVQQSEYEYNREISRKELQQQRELRRARGFAIFLGSASVVSLLLTLLALNLKFQAEDSEKIAQEQKVVAVAESIKAEDQRKEAVAQTKISEQHQDIAEQQQQIAEKEKQNAVSQRQEAERQRIIADQQRQEAQRQQTIAEEKKKEALTQKELAEKRKIEADQQREEAVRQEKEATKQRDKATKLRLLSVGRSLAIQSAILAKSVRSDLTSLLAYQAYSFVAKNNGSLSDPDVFKALSLAADDKPVLRSHTDAVRAVATSSDGSSAASAGDDGSVRVWNLGNLSAQTIKLPTKDAKNSAARSVCFSRDASQAAAGFFNGIVNVWDMKFPTRAPIVLLGNNSCVNAVLFDKKNGTVIVGCSNGDIKEWELSRSQNPVTTYSFGSKINALSLSPDGRFLLAGAEDGSIRSIPYRRSDEKIFTVQASGKPVRALAYSSDGTYFAAGDATGSVKVWEIRNGERSVVLAGHTSGVNSLMFSPDGEMLATASFDRTVRLWNYKHPELQPIALEGHDNWVWGLAFVGGGEKLITASADKTLRIWTTKSEILAKKICSSVSRKQLTSEEWSRYIGAEDDIPREITCQ